MTWLTNESGPGRRTPSGGAKGFGGPPDLQFFRFIDEGGSAITSVLDLQESREAAEELSVRRHAVSHQTVTALLEDFRTACEPIGRPRKAKTTPVAMPSSNTSVDRCVPSRRTTNRPSQSTPRRRKTWGFSRSRAGVASPSQAGGGPCQGLPDKRLGHAIPEGVYDLSRNEGWVSVGIDHDTPEFAGVSIRRWWEEMGSLVYPGARRLLITADAGAATAIGHGCGKWSCRVWRTTWACGSRSAISPGHEQVERDRAPHVFLRHEELAWQAASLASRHRQLDRRHDDEGGNTDPSKLDTDLYGLASGFPMNNSPKYNCRELHSTVNGTTRWPHGSTQCVQVITC